MFGTDLSACRTISKICNIAVAMLTTLRSQISTNTKLRDLKLDMTLEHAIQDSVNMKKLALTLGLLAVMNFCGRALSSRPLVGPVEKSDVECQTEFRGEQTMVILWQLESCLLLALNVLLSKFPIATVITVTKLRRASAASGRGLNPRRSRGVNSPWVVNKNL